MATVADIARARCTGLLVDPDVAAVAPAVERALDRLDQPLVVAVAGHVSAGKSTLVNALAGRRVAATGAAETTLVSWWLRRGTDERVVVRRRDGLPLELPLDAAGDLREADVDLDAPEPITVWVDTPVLDGLVIVDTPGLFSVHDERSARTRELVRDRTHRAAARADALIYVTADAPASQRDVAELDAFSAGFPDLGQTPTNAIVVLNKADRFWTGSGDPLATAAAALEAVRPAWRTRAWQAIGVTALLAGAEPGPGDAAVLDELAAAEDVAGAVRLLAARARTGQAPEAHAALLRRLGAFGLVRAAGAHREGRDVAEALRAASGVDVLRDAIDELFRRRAQTLRTDRLLRELEAIALGPDVDPAAARRLRAVVEDVRTGHDGGGLRVLLALRLADDPRIRLDEPARDEVRRVLARAPEHARLGLPGGTPGPELLARARDRARWWQALETLRPSGPDRRWLAAHVAGAYAGIARAVDATLPGSVSDGVRHP